MTTLATPRPAAGPSTSGVVFHDVTWDDYEAMLRIVGNRPIRVTYDRGTMEVFRPSFEHERDAYLLGRMVDTLTEEWDIPVEGGGTTTHKRPDLEKGAEPDQCYWLGENAARVRGKRQLDLAVDPPPDLVIEVDVTSSSLERLPLFAPMGVAEVWRFDGRVLRFLHLQADGSYQDRDTSAGFPGLPRADVARFLEEGRTAEKTAWIRSFRTFVRALSPPRPQERPEGAEQP